MSSVCHHMLPTVTSLVQQANTRHTYREMARIAHNAGHPISHTQLAAWGAGMITRAPSRQQAQAIAAAVGVTYEDVVDALAVEFYSGR